MEVVAAPPPPTGGTPFRDHDVREWSRIDSITGALERARLETDSWSANTSDASHRYGKVVDSRARTGADGSLQAQASRQLEVFQSRAAGARLQVVKTKTVSSSRWSGKGEAPSIQALGFEDLQLPLNPLDLSSQKSKASVGRSVNRRPPSRHPRTQNASAFSNDLHSHLRSAHFTAATNLHRVSRLCHQIHESAVRNAFGRKSPSNSRRGSADGSVSGVEITEIESSVTSNSDANSHSRLARTKSNSSDDIHQIPEKESSVKSVEDLEDLEQLQDWRRNSKIRRSLQFPEVSSPTTERSPIISDLPKNSVNVKKLRDELEKGRRLTAALRNNSISADLNALDNIIQSISSASSLERSSTDDNLDDLSERESLKTKKKRQSFVTVESLQEVKGRLRHTNSPGSDIYDTKSKEEESDDGIVTEDVKTDDGTETNRVKSYVYGMENMLQSKKSMIGTGSLESRSKFTNGTSNHKNEDWYNRRKSYGFEKVHGPEEPTSISLKGKNFVESSTDSGICRSSEIMVVPSATKSNTNETNGRYNSDESESDVENKFNSFNKPHNGINYGKVKKMTSIFNQEDKNPSFNRSSDELTKAWNKRPFKENDWKKNEIKSTTITIPIVKNNNVVDLSWNDEPEKEAKNADEKYASTNGIDNRYRKTSLASNDQCLDDDNLNNNRKAKKVEFCKTEVHFAAESGKVNIVETDEKPPPTQNFRRRRRNSGPIRDYPEDFNKNGLPMLHFGDTSYEKTMFGITNDEEAEKKLPTNIYNDQPPRIPSAFSVVTVNNTNEYNNHADYSEEERKDFLADNDNLKGILKNKPIKPKPYHLGETVPLGDSASDEDARKWGVRLRHVPKESAPIWKSTVTVHNTYHGDKEEEPTPNDQSQPEFQTLLRNLRPTMKKPDYMSDNENRYSDSFANIRVVPAAKDSRRSSWSVADRVKLVDEIQESKGYSTKVNFGDGEATVVQNDQSTWPRMENLSKDNSPRLKPTIDSSRPSGTYNKYSIHSNGISKFSPVVLRKSVPITTEPKELTKPEEVPSKSLNSPSLVNRKFESSIINSNRQSPTREFRNKPDPKLQAKYINENIVLRQPKKSEMTYFGVDVVPKTTREVVQTAVIKKEQKHLQKPDLLQHHKRTPSPSNKVVKPRRMTPESDRKSSASPIYENLKPVNKIKSKYFASNDFDSSILDELTKAADQILQAVNGYTSEDCQNRLSTDEEEFRKPLDTISETKSWKNSSQDLEMKNQQRMRPTLASAAKMKVKRTSSTSSVESLSKDRRKPSSTERRSTAAPVSKPVTERPKKTASSDASSTKASTKARRLQRASSREALLQSHGSSSEDLPTNIETPVRKPRLIKKTKQTQLSITNGLELKKPVRRSREEKVESSKIEARIMGSLPEIRHKTAISTITSTADKCSRDRSKTRSDESKAKSHTKRESSNKGTVSSSSTRPTSSSAGRGQQQQQHHHHHQSHRGTSSSKESGVTQHRISTANIKRCHRSESATRH